MQEVLVDRWPLSLLMVQAAGLEPAQLYFHTSYGLRRLALARSRCWLVSLLRFATCPVLRGQDRVGGKSVSVFQLPISKKSS
jgi:hypothetical protein